MHWENDLFEALLLDKVRGLVADTLSYSRHGSLYKKIVEAEILKWFQA